MKILKKFVDLINLYCSMLNRRDSNTWIFGAWFGEKFTDNPKQFYLYCLQQGINAVWFTKNSDLYKEMVNMNLPVCMMGTEEADKIAAHAKYNVFCTSSADTDLFHVGGAVNINLWHGIPIKKICHDDNISVNGIQTKIYRRIVELLLYLPTRKTFYFSTSEQVSKIYKQCFKTDDKHVIQIGQARNDAFFNGSLRKYSYDEIDYKKIVVYMPTHRNEGNKIIDLSRIFNLARLNFFCKENDILFMVKKHFYHKDEKTDLSDYSNVIDITNENVDTQELLYNADILITDYSSCYIDYLLLDRPVIFYNYDFEDYLVNDRDLYYNYNAVTPGEKVSTFDGLIDALTSAVSGNTEYFNKQKEIKELFYSPENQGLVCPKLLKKIMQLD